MGLNTARHIGVPQWLGMHTHTHTQTAWRFHEQYLVVTFPLVVSWLLAEFLTNKLYLESQKAGE